jgi:hypothetical protein
MQRLLPAVLVLIYVYAMRGKVLILVAPQDVDKSETGETKRRMICYNVHQFMRDLWLCMYVCMYVCVCVCVCVCMQCMYVRTYVRECIQKFPDWPPGARTANGTALCLCVQLYRYFVSQSSEFCCHNTLCCFSTSVCCLFRY